MKPELNSTQRLLCFVAVLIASQLSAAEKRPTRMLHAPPDTTASAAATPPRRTPVHL